MADKAPAFQFYVRDWLSSSHRKMMSLAAQGAYINLLAHAWDENPECPTIPNDPDNLWRLCDATPEEWKAIRSDVLGNFHEDEHYPGKLVNGRLLDIAIKRTQFCQTQTNRANRRWKKQDAEVVPDECRTDAGVVPDGYPSDALQSADCKPLGGAKKRATALPGDFAPNPGNLNLANKLGVDLGETLQAFKDFHQSKGNTFRDWHLALNTWLRNERRFGNKKPTHVTTGSLSENFRAMREKYEGKVS